jgi:hypothetical protein
VLTRSSALVCALFLAGSAAAEPRPVVVGEELSVYRALLKGVALQAAEPLEILGLEDEVAVERAWIAVGPQAAMALQKSASRGVICMVPRVEAYALDPDRIAAVRLEPAYRDQLALLRALFPARARIGVVHDPGASRETLARAAKVAAGLELVPIPARAPEEVAAALKAVEVDALWWISDPISLHVVAIEAQRAFAAERKLPVLAPGGAFVSQGATVALGVDFADVGAQAAAIAAQLDEGRKPREIGVVAPTAREITVRLDAAKLDPEVFSRLRRFAADTGRRVRYVP